MHGVVVREVRIEPHHAVGTLVLLRMGTHRPLLVPGVVAEIRVIEDGQYRLVIDGRGKEYAGRRWSNIEPDAVIEDGLEPEAA